MPWVQVFIVVCGVNFMDAAMQQPIAVRLHVAAVHFRKAHVVPSVPHLEKESLPHASLTTSRRKNCNATSVCLPRASTKDLSNRKTAQIGAYTKTNFRERNQAKAPGTFCIHRHNLPVFLKDSGKKKSSSNKEGGPFTSWR